MRTLMILAFSLLALTPSFSEGQETLAEEIKERRLYYPKAVYPNGWDSLEIIYSACRKIESSDVVVVEDSELARKIGYMVHGWGRGLRYIDKEAAVFYLQCAYVLFPRADYAVDSMIVALDAEYNYKGK